MAKTIRLGQLGKELDKILQDVSESEIGALDKALRKTYFDRLGAVILETPVDTGTLQNSWFLDMSFNNSKLGGNGGKSGDYIQEQLNGKNVINEAWYFYNNQPYVYRIEFDGHSDQAPRGMLRRNLISFGRKLRQYWKKERGNI